MDKRSPLGLLGVMVLVAGPFVSGVNGEGYRRPARERIDATPTDGPPRALLDIRAEIRTRQRVARFDPVVSRTGQPLRRPEVWKDFAKHDRPYTLEVLDCDGEVMDAVAVKSRVNLDLCGFDLPEPWGRSSILASVDDHPDIGGLRLRDNDGVLGELRRGQPPTVEWLHPIQGATWGIGQETLQWRAHDPDGDSLFFSVDYSHDGGRTWEFVTHLYLDEAQLPVDVGELHAAEAALFRVTAMDGFHATTVVSIPVAVPQSAPRVWLSPDLTGTPTRERPFVLFCFGEDAEDGRLAKDRIVWLLDGERADGRGNALDIDTYALPSGVHTVTVRYEDTSGLVARDTVRFHIRERFRP